MAIGGELVERLGAVAGLQQERAPGGDLGQRVAQLAGLAGEHQRRERAEPLGDRLRRGRSPATAAGAAPRRVRQEDGDHVGEVAAMGGFSLPSGVAAPLRTRPRSIDTIPHHDTRVFRHSANRSQAPGQLHRRDPPLRHRPGPGRGLLLRGRPALDLDSPTTTTTLRENTLDTAATLLAAGPRPRPLHAVRAEPRARARRGRVAAGARWPPTASCGG